MAIPEFSFATLNAARSSKAPEIRLCLNLPKSEKQLNEIFAMPNLTELFFDVSEGFGEIPESIKNAKKLRFLKIEKLQKKGGEHVLPKVFLEMHHLELFSVVECSNLLWGSDDWSGLKNLNFFYTYMGGTEFPMGVFSLPNLQSLDISSNTYPSLPTEIVQIKTLKSLYINARNMALPASITQLPNLEKINLWTKTTPEWLGKLSPKLKSLSFYPSTVSETITDEIFDYKELTYLSLYHVGLKKISPKIGQLTQLETLILSGNQLSELPDEFANLQNLSSLTLHYNPFVKIPGAIAKLPKLSKFEFKERGTHSSELTRFEKFLNWFEIHSYTPELRHFLADRWDAKPINPQNLDYNLAEKALFCKLSPIDTNMLHSLTHESKQAYRPLKSGDVLFAGGKTSLKKTELKIKLKSAGIELASKLDEKTTHFLVDEKCSVYPFHWLGKDSFCLMTDKQLVDFLNEVQPDYLVEDAQQHQASDMVASANLLLFSLETANIEIALNLLKSGGVPEACKTALFCAYKLAEDSKHRSLAGKLLQQVASPALRDAMQKRVIFQNLKHIGYITLAGYFSVFENTEIDMCRFALAFKKQNSKEDILFYLMRKGNSEALREFFASQVNGDSLKVNMPYNYQGTHHIPLEVFETKGFSYFSVYIYSSQWTMDSIFPEDYLKFTQVDKMDIYIGGKSLTEIPPVLKKMTWLRQLKINLNEYLIEELKTYLPDCKVTKH